MSRKFGIDISTWQRPAAINYDSLAKEIDFAILRAGYTGHGTGHSYHKDDAFDRHYAELAKRGVPIGAYWYSCADTVAEGRAEANQLLSIVKDKRLDYPLIIDVEDEYHQAKAGRSRLTDAVVAFCQTIEAAGYYCSIYTSSWWINNLLDLERIKRYDLWIAQWSQHRPKVAHGMWQYSSAGKLPGYGGDLDFNYAYKDYPKLIKDAGLNHLGKEADVKLPEPAKPYKVYEMVGAYATTQEAQDHKARLELDGKQAIIEAPQIKTVEALAAEVWAGKWGDYPERKNRLEEAGYNFEAVQKRVEETHPGR